MQRKNMRKYLRNSAVGIVTEICAVLSINLFGFAFWKWGFSVLRKVQAESVGPINIKLNVWGRALLWMQRMRWESRTEFNTCDYTTWLVPKPRCRAQERFYFHNVVGCEVYVESSKKKAFRFTPFRRLYAILGAFAKLPEAKISFLMSVCLSVCPHGIFRLSLAGFW
jgi:hypothetical protein